jgi:hypothetical protein
MSRIERPSPNEFSEPEPEVRYLPVDDAGPTVEALGSETAQSILSEMDVYAREVGAIVIGEPSPPAHGE